MGLTTSPDYRRAFTLNYCYQDKTKMPHHPDDLTYDLERLRLLVLADESAGLDEWEVAVAEFRDAYLLDDCRRLLNAAKAWPLSEHGRARVREEEAVLAIAAGDWPRAGRLLQDLLDTYRSLADRHQR